jgi:hypothetical protein
MKTKKTIIMLLGLLMSLLLTSVFASQIPTRVESIPIYPGAVVVKNDGAILGNVLSQVLLRIQDLGVIHILIDE